MNFPISVIHGVNFFDNAAECISHYKKSSWSKKAISLIQSFGTLFLYVLDKFISSVKNVDAQMNPLTRPGTDGFSKKRLIVCIHGLNNKPSQFKKIISEIQKGDILETNIYVPHVLQKGNARLDDMIKPIFEEIALWAKTSEDKELVLIGISNGGRIARAIEAEIAKSDCSVNIKKLRFVSIVGACKGSSLVNLANKIGLSWLMSKNISEEMPINSLRTRRLNQEWEDGLAHGPIRNYTFIASPHDWQVTNYSSSLMAVNNQNVRYAIVPGHGHNSIVNAVATTVAEVISQT